MKWLLAVIAIVLLLSLAERDRRITQLECALAQTHGEIDTLEVMLETVDSRTATGTGGLRQ